MDRRTTKSRSDCYDLKRTEGTYGWRLDTDEN